MDYTIFHSFKVNYVRNQLHRIITWRYFTIKLKSIGQHQQKEPILIDKTIGLHTKPFLLGYIQINTNILVDTPSRLTINVNQETKQ